jgi:hypothetical protein
MNELENLKSEITALRSIVIAIYSINLDRQLIETKASYIHERLLTLETLDTKNAKQALKKLLQELHDYGFQ